jgi:hypothetical protein
MTLPARLHRVGKIVAVLHSTTRYNRVAAWGETDSITNHRGEQLFAPVF